MAFTYAGQYTEALLATGSSGATLLPSLAVNVYTVGTTTAVTLYTSRTKGTTTANPVSTDANGNLTFFADPGQYDIVFTPPGGSAKRVTVSLPVDAAESGTSGAGLPTTFVAKTANYTAAAGDYVEATTTSGFTVTLPSAPAAGALVAVQKVSSDTNAVTVAPSGSGTIDGAATKAMSTQYQGAVFEHKGSDVWHYVPLGQNPSLIVETVQAVTASTSTTGINIANGSVVKLTVNVNTTVTFSGMVTGQYFTVIGYNTGAFTLAFSGSVKWPGATVPTFTSGAGKIDTFSFFYDGTNILGSVLQNLA